MEQRKGPRSIEELKSRLKQNAPTDPTGGRSAQVMRPKQQPREAKKLNLEELHVPQWKGSIQSEQAPDTLRLIQTSVMPWLEISEKLLAHTHMQAQAITLLQRQDNTDETVKKLTKRVASIVALKEDVDEFLSKECTRVLEGIEAEHVEETDAD